MGGWLRHFVLTAKAKTGFSAYIVVWAVIAAVSAAAMFFSSAWPPSFGWRTATMRWPPAS